MAVLPRKIYLLAINGLWRVSYIHAPEKLVVIQQPHHRLVVYGRRRSKRSAQLLLSKWVRLKSKEYLSKTIARLSHQTRIKYKKLSVRSQKTQWGSYSTSGTISLNYKLIFLPSVLVNHIIIHELCHRNCLDHSDKFWKLVAKYDPHWKRHRKEMDEADVYIPEWLV